MKRELNIIFMGTPEFAVSSLEALIENHYKVVAVVTAPDKPAGRGRKMNTSAVKQYALSKGLTVLQPKRLKNEYFLKVLQALHVNLIV
ncbi:MAG: methionyl-tRNA formyltransferase, partial [Bacteroidia bacterium]|nr:methionyl-tRNA formyltransferase [Bacteroidia bacterium]